MKIQENKTFQPITIIIESQKELEILVDRLNTTYNDNTVKAYINWEPNVRSYDTREKIFDLLWAKLRPLIE